MSLIYLTCLFLYDVYLRGWEAERAVPKGKSVVLNVEQEHERQRRLGDEFNAKLQRERSVFNIQYSACVVALCWTYYV